jgi:hypothetical protein
VEGLKFLQPLRDAGKRRHHIQCGIDADERHQQVRVSACRPARSTRKLALDNGGKSFVANTSSEAGWLPEKPA